MKRATRTNKEDHHGFNERRSGSSLEIFLARATLRASYLTYAPGAVLFTPDGPLKGVKAIRPLFEAIFAEFGNPAQPSR